MITGFHRIVAVSTNRGNYGDNADHPIPVAVEGFFISKMSGIAVAIALQAILKGMRLRMIREGNSQPLRAAGKCPFEHLLHIDTGNDKIRGNGSSAGKINDIVKRRNGTVKGR